MTDETRKTGKAMQPTETKSGGQRSGGLGKEIQTKIGQQLRAMYDEVVQQGVPDRFADLIKQLEKRDGEDPKDPGS